MKSLVNFSLYPKLGLPMLRRFFQLSTKPASALNKLPQSFLNQKNDLHIKSTYLSYNKSKILSSIIIETSNDEYKEEIFTHYSDRSKKELAAFVSKHFSDRKKKLILIKVNQCLIDPVAWNKGIIKPIHLGHVMMGIFNLENGDLTPHEKTLVSKIPVKNDIPPNYFEPPKKFMSSLFTDRDKYQKAFAKGSKEYFWIIDLEAIKLTLDQYINNFQTIINEGKEWKRDSSACGQAVKRVLNGKQDSLTISPQTAAREGVLDTLTDDLALKNSLMAALEESGLALRAYDLGEMHSNSPQNSKKYSR